MNHATPEPGSGPQIGGLAIALLLLSLLVTTVPPAHNWDMVAYVALVNGWSDSELLEELEDRQAAVHQQTWAAIRQGVSGQKYAQLRGESVDPDSTQWPLEVINYRQAVASDPAVLAAQLPFYAVKPLYPALLTGLSVLGVGAVAASVAISKVAWVIMGGILFTLLRRRVPLLPSLGVLVALMSQPFVRALAGYSTPDALCSVFVLAALHLALDAVSHRQRRLALLCCLLAVVTRPDSILLVTPIALWLTANRRDYWRECAAAVLLALLCCAAQSYLSGSYGWQVLFQHSFMGYLHFPATDAVDLSIADILAVYLAQLANTGLFWGVVGLAGLVAFVRLQWLGASDHWFCGLLVILVFLLTHWLLFPDQKDRMMVAPYLFAFVAATHLLTALLGRGGSYATAGETAQSAR